jgi:hypothetical protein
MVPKPVSSFATIAPNRSIVTLANHIAVVRAKWHDARFSNKIGSPYAQRIHRSSRPC